MAQAWFGCCGKYSCCPRRPCGMLTSRFSARPVRRQRPERGGHAHPGGACLDGGQAPARGFRFPGRAGGQAGRRGSVVWVVGCLSCVGACEMEREVAVLRNSLLHECMCLAVPCYRSSSSSWPTACRSAASAWSAAAPPRASTRRCVCFLELFVTCDWRVCDLCGGRSIIIHRMTVASSLTLALSALGPPPTHPPMRVAPRL